MILTDLRLVAETGDHAFWMADDEQGNVVVCGHQLIRFPAGSLVPRTEDSPEGLVGEFIEDHVLTLVSDEQGPRLLLPRGMQVRLPETAAGGCYGTAYDRSRQKLYLLTVNSMLEVSLQSLEVKTTQFEHPPDAPYAHYERIAAREGCAAAYRDGLGFWSPHGEFRCDERPYSVATVVGPDRVIAAEERGPVRTFDASGNIVEERPGPPGPIRFLDIILGEPFVVWVEGSPMFHLGRTDRTVELGDTELPLYQVWSEGESAYARMLRSNREDPVSLGGFGVGNYAIIPEARCVAFGTTEGVIVLWDTSRHEVEAVELPERDSRRNPRIVSLLWCEPRQLLFVGTRDGGVYTARVEPGIE